MGSVSPAATRTRTLTLTLTHTRTRTLTLALTLTLTLALPLTPKRSRCTFYAVPDPNNTPSESAVLAPGRPCAARRDGAGGAER